MHVSVHVKEQTGVARVLHEVRVRRELLRPPLVLERKLVVAERLRRQKRVTGLRRLIGGVAVNPNASVFDLEDGRRLLGGQGRGWLTIGRETSQALAVEERYETVAATSPRLPGLPAERAA